MLDCLLSVGKQQTHVVSARLGLTSQRGRSERHHHVWVGLDVWPANQVDAGRYRLEDLRWAAKIGCITRTFLEPSLADCNQGEMFVLGFQGFQV